MRQKTLFEELTGEDRRTRPEKNKRLRPDTINYFFIEEGHVMEYYQADDEKIIAMFFGPWEFVLPSHADFSRYTFFDRCMAAALRHGQVIRALRRDPELAEMYREVEEQYRKKVADRIYVARNYTPKERFMHLMDTQPWVFELAVEEDIANYLDVEVWQLHGLQQTVK